MPRQNESLGLAIGRASHTAIINELTQYKVSRKERCDRCPLCTLRATELNNTKIIKLFMQLSIPNVQFIAVCKNFLLVRGFGVLLGKIVGELDG